MEIFQQILNGTIGAAGLIILLSILIFIFKESMTGLIGRSLQREVNKHKHELDSLQEHLRHNLQKDAISAEVVITERHKIYTKLRKLLLIAEGKVGGLYGVSRSLTFEEYGPEDFEKYLMTREITKEKLDNILAKFRNDKARGVKEWKDYERVLEIQNAHLVIQKAVNYWLKKELYLTEDVSKLVKQIVGNLKERLLRIEMPDPSNRMESREVRELDQKIKRELDELKTAMRSELQKSSN